MFCSECGTKIEQAPQNEQPQYEQPQYEQSSFAQPEYAQPEQTAYAQPEAPTFEQEILNQQANGSFAQADFPVKKKKNIWARIIVSFVSLAASLGLVFGVALPVLGVFFPGFSFFGTYKNPLVGLALKTFAPASTYSQYVEQKAINNGFENIEKTYASLISGSENSATSGTATIDVTVGDAIKKQLGSDFDWIDDISIAMEVDASDAKKIGTVIKLLAGDTNVIDVAAILDMADQYAYIGIPSLTDKYLGAPIEGEIDNTALSEALSNLNLSEILPSEKDMKKLVTKYWGIAIKEFKAVEKSSEKISIDEIEQKCTVLEIEINQYYALCAAKAVLEEAKDDKQIIEILEKVSESGILEKMGVEDIDLAEEFADGIDSALEELDDTLDEFDEDDDSIATLKTFVNGSHEIIGREIEINGQSLFFATVEKGKNFETEISFEDAVKLIGSGTNEKDVINASYTLTVQGKEMGTIEVIDYDAKKAKDEGLVNGKIRITPSSEIIEMLEQKAGITLSAVNLLDPALEIGMTSEKDSAKLDLNVCAGDSIVAGISITVSNKEVSIKAPSDSNVIDVENANEWLQSLDFEKLYTALRNAGVPEQYITMIPNLLTGSVSSGASYEGETIYYDDNGNPLYQDEYGNYYYYDEFGNIVYAYA